MVGGLQVLDSLDMFACTIFVGVESDLGKTTQTEHSKQNKVRKRCLRNERKPAVAGLPDPKTNILSIKN
jgi:hypothetical protein